LLAVTSFVEGECQPTAKCMTYGTWSMMLRRPKFEADAFARPVFEPRCSFETSDKFSSGSTNLASDAVIASCLSVVVVIFFFFLKNPASQETQRKKVLFQLKLVQKENVSSLSASNAGQLNEKKCMKRCLFAPAEDSADIYPESVNAKQN
jgi:hypothetical protein